MKPDKLDRAHLLLYAVGALAVIWLGLLLAPALDGGLAGLLRDGGGLFEHPFRIVICEASGKTVLVLLLAYGVCLGLYLSNDKNYRRREEHGSARWGKAGELNRKYASPVKSENKILTQNVALGLDGRKHRRNLNVLVCGGSGAGKTRFFAKPNVMNANTSFVCLDPKGELLRDTGGLLKAKGYDIKVIDLINMERSHCYNPFVYLRGDKFNLDTLASITQNDEMELWSLGERKTAIYAVIPDNDSSFNFIIGMLYTQLFQQLYYQADVVHSGRLPVHVHFVMDEFANVNDVF